MSTRRFDTAAAPKAAPDSGRYGSVPDTAAAERTGHARFSPLGPGIGVPRSRARAAALTRFSDGHLARAGGALLQLQGLYGNRSVQQIIAHTRGHAQQAANPETAPVIQTKLTVGPAADVYEQEADRVADAVMRSPSGQDGAAGESELKKGELLVSRKVSASVDPLGGTSIDTGSEVAIARARTGGVPLQPAVRSRMETAFGSDFGAVRIHQGPEVDMLNRQLQARAFTSGSHIFFASGAYRPASSSGQALLAHELTHVVQQGAAERISRVPDRPAADEKDSPPVQVRRAGRAVQRAILAIDGSSDPATALASTRNCLSNLRERKQIRTSTGKADQYYSAGDARGQVYGPAVAATALSDLAAGSSTIGPLETLYILGHGKLTDIAGLTPSDLATKLVKAFALYPGTFIGALKIVACYSASTMLFGGNTVSTYSSLTKEVATSYADRLRTELDIKDDARFRPGFVEGIQGIAWADEDTGRRVGYEVLGATPGSLSPLEQIYADPKSLNSWYAALAENDRVKRKKVMDAILEKKHKDLGLLATPRAVVGKGARVRYPSKAARSDFEVAARQLELAARNRSWNMVVSNPGWDESAFRKPDKALAEAALKRMRLDWESMDTADREAMQTTAMLAHQRYLWEFHNTLPSQSATRQLWPI